jgi:hypothetical protein
VGFRVSSPLSMWPLPVPDLRRSPASMIDSMPTTLVPLKEARQRRPMFERDQPTLPMTLGYDGLQKPTLGNDSAASRRGPARFKAKMRSHSPAFIGGFKRR